MSRSPNTEHGFYGVTKVAEGRYVASVNVKQGSGHYKRIHIGSYPRADYAAIARERYIDKHKLYKTSVFRNDVKDTGVDLSRWTSKEVTGFSSNYTGVFWCNTRKKWGASFWMPDKKKMKLIGYYDDEDTAMIAREAWMFNNGYLENLQTTEETR